MEPVNVESKKEYLRTYYQRNKEKMNKMSKEYYKRTHRSCPRPLKEGIPRRNDPGYNKWYYKLHKEEISQKRKQKLKKQKELLSTKANQKNN